MKKQETGIKKQDVQDVIFIDDQKEPLDFEKIFQEVQNLRPKT